MYAFRPGIGTFPESPVYVGIFLGKTKWKIPARKAGKTIPGKISYKKYLNHNGFK